MLDMARAHHRRYNEDARDSSNDINRLFTRGFSQACNVHKCVPPTQAHRRRANERPCRLWHANVVMIFPTLDVGLDANSKQFAALDEDSKNRARLIVDDMINKASAPPSESAPLHACVAVCTDGNVHRNAQQAQIAVCDEQHGMTHCALFENLMYSTYRTTGSYRILDAPIHVDCVRDVYPRELQSDGREFQSEQARVLNLERDQVVQNSVCAQIVSGTWIAREFAGVAALNARLRFVAIKNCYMCPSAPLSALLHDCSSTGCLHHDTMSGEATCSMTHLSIQNTSLRMRNAYMKQGQSEAVPCYDRQVAVELRNSAQRDDRHDRQPIDRTAIENNAELRGDMEYHFVERQQQVVAAIGGEETVDAVNDDDDDDNEMRERYRNLTTSRSNRNAQRRKRAIDHLRNRLRRISKHSQDAQKMLNTRHISSPHEYVREAEFRIGMLIGTGVEARAAMAITLTENVYKESVMSSDAATRRNSRRTMKWYTIPEKEEQFRASAKRRMDMSPDVHVEVKVIRDEGWLKKIIEEKVRALAQKCVLFWTLLRHRTQYARKRPNEFAITSFALAFAYAVKHGLYVTLDGCKHVIVTKSRFLMRTLPNMAHIEQKHYSFDKESTRRCKSSIVQALKEHCTHERNSPNTVSPEVPDNVSLDLEAVANAHPDLFHGIKRRRNKER